MLAFGVVQRIRALLDLGAVTLAHRLMVAEAGRRTLPLDQFRMSNRHNVGDEGVDGRSDFPAPAEPYPAGPCVWQVKSGRTTPSARSEFKEEHVALREAVKSGSDYVLFWTYDPTDQVEENVRKAFEDEVQALRPDAKCYFLFADRIERLCLMHLAVAVEQLGVAVDGLVTLPRWMNQFAAEYHPDQARIETAKHIVDAVTDPESTDPWVHVLGDAGVGKSHLVGASLDTDRVRDRVLVGDASHIEERFLTTVIESDERHVVLVADECSDEDAKRLRRMAEMAQGRIRLITIGPRRSRHAHQIDDRFVEVRVLDPSASKAIALSTGIDEAEADLVAKFTEGYPRLTHLLARAIRTSPEANLIDRVRGLEVEPVLEAMVAAAEDRDALGLLALFERLGFEDELSPETKIVCKAFGVNEALFRETVRREEGRFVSPAGRYRQVTPRLLAIWLAERFIRARRETLPASIAKLPDSLMNAFSEQMALFAGDTFVTSLIEEILESPPFVEGGILQLSEGASRLLRASAEITPAATAAALERLADGVSNEDLLKFDTGRRNVVWALELLVWFEEAFEAAASLLFRLAIAENETWANNASGAVGGIFRVYLGGTSSAFSRRIAWAKKMLATHGGQGASILVKAFANSLDLFETRTEPNFGPSVAPKEWKPNNVEEEVGARKEAWQLLWEIASAYPDERDEALTVIVGSLRAGLTRGFVEMLDDLERSVDELGPRHRVVLSEQITHRLEYDEPPSDEQQRLNDLKAVLQAGDLSQQIAFVINASPWELTESELGFDEPPKEVAKLSARLAAEGLDAICEAATNSVDGNEQTVFMLFRDLGLRMAEPEHLDALVEVSEANNDVPLVGYAVGLLRAREEMDGLLNNWLGEGRLAKLVPQIVHFLPATSERLDVALRAVEQGSVPASELGRFLLGAWTVSLGETDLLRLLKGLSSSIDERHLQPALGILEQWVEKHGAIEDPELQEVSVKLVMESFKLKPRPSSMLPYYRDRLMKHLPIDFGNRLEFTLQALRIEGQFPLSEDVEGLMVLCKEDPYATIEAFIAMLGDGIASRAPWVSWMSHGHLVSRLQQCNEDALMNQLLHLDQAQWPDLLDHIDFSNDDVVRILQPLFAQRGDEVLISRATYRFLYPTVHTGSQSSLFESAKERARRLMTDAHPSLAEWLNNIMVTVDEQLPRILREEQEQRW